MQPCILKGFYLQDGYFGLCTCSPNLLHLLNTMKGKEPDYFAKIMDKALFEFVFFLFAKSDPDQ